MGNGENLKSSKRPMCTFSYMFDLTAFLLFGIKAVLEQAKSKAEMMRLQWELLRCQSWLYNMTERYFSTCMKGRNGIVKLLTDGLINGLSKLASRSP